jgi:hypothetical protein
LTPIGRLEKRTFVEAMQETSLPFYSWNFWEADLLTLITAPFSALSGD